MKPFYCNRLSKPLSIWYKILALSWENTSFKLSKDECGIETIVNCPKHNGVFFFLFYLYCDGCLLFNAAFAGTSFIIRDKFGSVVAIGGMARKIWSTTRAGRRGMTFLLREWQEGIYSVLVRIDLFNWLIFLKKHIWLNGIIQSPG